MFCQLWEFLIPTGYVDSCVLLFSGAMVSLALFLAASSPTPPSRPRVSGKNTTPPPTTAGGALPSPKPQWLYAAVHGSEGALRTSHRLALDHQTAESMHRIIRLNHSPHPVPALCSTQYAGARPRRSARGLCRASRARPRCGAPRCRRERHVHVTSRDVVKRAPVT